MKEINYNKLRLDVLESLVCSRMIECNDNRTDMVRKLKLEDEGKYIRKTIVEKSVNGFLIGIDIAHSEHSNQMGKLIERGDAIISHYAFGRIFYESTINILEDGLE